MLATEPDTDFLIVAAPEAGHRIDQFLAARFSHFSRTYFQALIEEGFVLLNGETVKKRILLEPGDEIEVCFRLTPECSLEPEAIPLDILFEDETIIAVNKPAGMVVHPAPGHRNGTFVNALLAHCRELAPSHDILRPGIVHRLDKDTSGVLIAAKTSLAHQKLVAQFSTRKIEKTYLAFCVGRPPHTMISAPIGRNPFQRKEMAIVEGGKEAISQIQVLAFDAKVSLVLIRPQTGRTHQIRVHLKHIGHPILGDATYGSRHANESLGAERQLLHAYRLALAHPITDSPLVLTAPIPDDMKAWMRKLAFNL